MPGSRDLLQIPVILSHLVYEQTQKEKGCRSKTDCAQYLYVEKKVRIGLLSDVEHQEFNCLGNRSIGGAYMTLLSNGYRRQAHEVWNNMIYIDFFSDSCYMDEFTSAMFLPHTDLEKFPNVMN